MSKFSESDITLLSPREHVRHRPHMYIIGGIDQRGLHQLVLEVLSEAIDAALLKQCDHVQMILLPENTVSVMDNGEGIPVEVDPDTKKSILEMVMVLPPVSKPWFSKSRRFVPKSMNIGLTGVNPLSIRLTAQVKRDGYLWQQTYSEGIPTTELTQVRPLEPNESTEPRLPSPLISPFSSAMNSATQLLPDASGNWLSLCRG